MIDLKKNARDAEYKKKPIIKEKTACLAKRYPMGSIRMAQGRIVTEEDLAAKRQKANEIKLP